MSSIELKEHSALSNVTEPAKPCEEKENLSVTDLNDQLPSVHEDDGDIQKCVNDEETTHMNIKLKEKENSRDGRPNGWESVRKRLGTLVAVKTVMDEQKKHKPKKLVDQKDFLQKFSTREYNSMKTANKTSVNVAQRRISVVQRSNVCNTELARDPAKEDCKDQSVDGFQVKDAIIVDCSSSIGGQGFLCHNNGLSGRILSTFFEPYSTFIYFWLYLVNLAITYNIWVILLRVAFIKAQTKYKYLWYFFDYVADFIYVLDMIISSRTSFLENGIYVDDLKRMAMAYLKSYQFALDVVSVLPLDCLYLLLGTTPTLRLLRILKYYKTFGSQKTILALTTYPNVLRTIIFLHIMLIMMHWNACFYFIISKYEGFGINNWVYPKFDEKTESLSYQYAFCYYWSTLSLTTIGGSAHPETAFECVYMIVCYVIGIFIFASIVGQAGNVIQNMSATRFDFEKQRDSTIQYMKRHNVPEDMQRRVRLWYDYSYSRGRFQGNDINDMRLLPNKMKTELALHVHLETLRRVTFLQKCQPEFLHDLVLKMKMIIYTPGDYVCRKGEIAREMYVISDGILEVISEAGRLLKELHSGDFFGEIGILSLSKGQNRRTADVRAYGYVELFVLSKEDVLNAIREYPLAQKILARYGRNRLRQDINRKDGPRGDTTTSDTDNEITSSFLNVNGGSTINQYEIGNSSDSRRCSFRRSLIRSGSDVRSNIKVKAPAETDGNESRILQISNQFMQSSNILHGTMMSVINPVVSPVSSVLVSTSPKLSGKKSPRSSVLVNNNAVMAESEDKVKANEQKHTRRCSKDDKRILQLIEASQGDLLEKIEHIVKKKMEKSQKKILEKIKELNEAEKERNRNIEELLRAIMLNEDKINLETSTIPKTLAHDDGNGVNDVSFQAKGGTILSIPEIICE